jgi:hypothetical protein
VDAVVGKEIGAAEIVAALEDLAAVAAVAAVPAEVGNSKIIV